MVCKIVTKINNYSILNMCLFNHLLIDENIGNNLNIFCLYKYAIYIKSYWHVNISAIEGYVICNCFSESIMGTLEQRWTLTLLLGTRDGLAFDKVGEEREWEWPPCVNTMGADILATQEARSSATTLLTAESTMTGINIIVPKMFTNAFISLGNRK